ncbi:Nuclear transcription factor, X box-binding protein 1 [Intoshia linei]|uniref:Nuclear transcription factor, X box-binding protein 1 n=1 Tax=Intoshia linei TaxID=1819745 RepID=A0A177B2E9_9BILA|nr:Nuclear transcription factor, X box-binding protein 1 [Intoshia linei]
MKNDETETYTLLREKQIHEIESNCLNCVICHSNIYRNEETWTCVECFIILHLKCIKNWFSELSFRKKTLLCPLCKCNINENPQYTCFCRKKILSANSYVNSSILAHSCGEICGKLENDQCGHPCTMLCHPGQCVECRRYVEKLCSCGKQTRLVKCLEKEYFSCNNACGKPLNCVNPNVHTCQQICHIGPCSSCDFEWKISCYCNKSIRYLSCFDNDYILDSNTKFKCLEVCNKLLSCENHYCEMICHTESCLPCPYTSRRFKTCSCGKTNIKDFVKLDYNLKVRKKCTDDLNVCPNICGKVVNCKFKNLLHLNHKCHQKCHQPTKSCKCADFVILFCKCRKFHKKIACQDFKLQDQSFECNVTCKTLMSCNKHSCNVKCCTDKGNHICLKVCQKMQSCGKHVCNKPCHVGPCGDCLYTDFRERVCLCGQTVIYPPIFCSIQMTQCENICQIKCLKCDGIDNHKCHFSKECSPCERLINTLCFCGKKTLKMKCSSKQISCNLRCQKKLDCGHLCNLICHQDHCITETRKCFNKCKKIKRCLHACYRICHSGHCDDKICEILITVVCKCGTLKEKIKCNQYKKMKFENIKNTHVSKNSLQLEKMNDTACENLKILSCNDKCDNYSHQIDLANAFNVSLKNVDLNPNKQVGEYNTFVFSLNLKFFCQAENVLIQCVENCRKNNNDFDVSNFDIHNNKEKIAFVEM